MDIQNRIIVDDAIIITDVDKLIRAISNSKTLSIAQLERITNMDRNTIEKWVEALEDEGYVRVEHRITDRAVTWLGDAETPTRNQESATTDPELSTSPLSNQERQSREPFPKKTQENAVEEIVNEVASESNEEVYTQPNDPRDVAQDENVTPERLAQMINSTDDDETKKRVDAIMEKLDDNRESTAQENADNTEENEKVEEVLTRFAGSSANEQKKTLYGRSSISDDIANNAESPFRRQVNDAKEITEETENEEEIEEVESETSERGKVTKQVTKNADESGTNRKSGRVRETVGRYMADINRQKNEIENLKHEKEKLYRERYLALESKTEADMAMITEKILEKEGRILELKERVLELPLKIDEVDKMRKSMAQIEQQGKGTLKDVSSRVSKFIDDVRKSEGALTQKMEEGRAVVDQANQKLTKLRELGLVVERRVDDLKARTTETELQIDELNKAMRDMLSELEEATEMKVEVTEIENRVKVAVDKKEEELDTLVNDLEEIKKIEHWVNEYVSDYEQKLDEITNYAQESEEELDKLRELAEGEHLKRYLKGLEQLTRSYQSEMGDITDEQKSIDQRMDEAKTRLNSMLTESQELIRKLQRETSSIEDFKAAAESSRNRVEGIRKRVEEKEKERDRLKEDTSKVKKKRIEKKKARRKGRK